MGANLRPPNQSTIRLGTKARQHINAGILINRLKSFCLADPDRPKPGDVRMTRTQVHVALALLRKVLPDLASLEVSGNPDKPLVVNVLRFSDTAEAVSAPLIDVTPAAAVTTQSSSSTPDESEG